MNRIMNKIDITAVIWGRVILINFCNGPAPSTSAASYNSLGTAWRRAKINRKASGKYLHISKIITVVNANRNLRSKPKKLIVKYF